jgi:arylsulfatase A-like enzyme
MNTIIILADTTIRSYLGAYGNDWTITPNLDRLAARSCIFDQHWCGSAPCVPARRDFFTGRLNFLERPWGGAEAFDVLLPDILRKQAGVYSHLVTDHSFYWTPGGENYHWAFDSWVLERGQEHDVYHSLNQTLPIPEHRGQWSQQYYKNQMLFKTEEDFPSPRTYSRAMEWLDQNHESENFLLWVESFDPHEPFDTPQEYLDLYEDDYEGVPYFWPAYAPCEDTPEENRHIRKRYAAALTMTDRWIGKLLDKLDEYDLRKDTMVIFTTDHGFCLGEHGYMAKNYMPAYNEVFHIPLLISLPGQTASRRIDTLTQTTDLFSTVLDVYGIGTEDLPNKIHGRSLLPLLRGQTPEDWRTHLIYGYYGKSVNLTDGRHTYFRVPANEANTPLNIYASLPTTLRQYMGIQDLSDPRLVEHGRFLSWTDYPVYKIPAQNFDFKNDSQTFSVRGPYNTENLLFDIQTDYEQLHPLQDPDLEQQFTEILKTELGRHDSPPEQYERLGLEV